MKKIKNILLGLILLTSFFVAINTMEDYSFLLTKNGIKNFYNYIILDYKQEIRQLEKKYNLEIRYQVNENFLPSFWEAPPYNVVATQLSDFEVSMFFPALKNILLKFPDKIIQKNLRGIFIAKTLQGSFGDFAGTFTNDIVYITNEGFKYEKSQVYLAPVFFHEFNSILRLNYHFNDKRWTILLPANFKYSNNIFRTNDQEFSKNGSKKLYKQGFISGYSKMSLDNDVSEYSAMIFSEPQKFKSLMEKYPLIRKKFEVWLEFYQSIAPIFTEEYLFGEVK